MSLEVFLRVNMNKFLRVHVLWVMELVLVDWGENCSFQTFFIISDWKSNTTLGCSILIVGVIMAIGHHGCRRCLKKGMSVKDLGKPIQLTD